MSSGQSAPSANGRGNVLANVQALRALAAMMVVVLHSARLLEPFGIRHQQLEFLAVGVDLFFVISGFIMVHTTVGRRVTGIGFLANRIARVVPLYWFVTLLLFVGATAAPSLFSRPDTAPVDLLRSLLFIPYRRLDGLIQPVLFLGWTLNYEMFFYLLFAVGLGLGRGSSKGVLTIGAILLIVGAGGLLPPTATWSYFYTRPIMLEFVGGMGIALLLRRLPERPASAMIPFAGMFAGFILLLAHGRGESEIASIASRLVGATLVVGTAILLERAGWRLGSGGVLLLGNASYSLYLVHPFAVQAVTVLAVAMRAPPWLALFAALVAACAVGIGVHLWIERPLARAARFVLKGRTDAAPAGGL